VKRTLSLLGAAAFGAGFVFVTDPALGRRRRALARDAFVHGAKVLRRAVDITTRDAAHRLKGFVESGKKVFRREEISDEVLADRVRTEIGRVSSHPNVEVMVEDGCVTLLGPIAAQEEIAVLAAAESVRGVCSIVNRMEPHVLTANIQTQAPRLRRLDILQKHWAPSTRVLVGSIGASMLVAPPNIPAPARVLLRAAGLTLLTRAATNLDLKSLIAGGNYESQLHHDSKRRVHRA
jgi:hypothetical protein